MRGVKEKTSRRARAAEWNRVVCRGELQGLVALTPTHRLPVRGPEHETRRRYYRLRPPPFHGSSCQSSFSALSPGIWYLVGCGVGGTYVSLVGRGDGAWTVGIGDQRSMASSDGCRWPSPVS